jgi:hypothetical protein
VSLSECKNLSDTLKMMPGGSTFLPFSCSAMISHEEKTMADRFEQQNAKVYKRVSQSLNVGLAGLGFTRGILLYEL